MNQPTNQLLVVAMPNWMTRLPFERPCERGQCRFQGQPGTPSPLSSYQASLCPIPEEIQRIQSHLHDTVDGRNPAPLGFV